MFRHVCSRFSWTQKLCFLKLLCSSHTKIQTQMCGTLAYFKNQLLQILFDSEGRKCYNILLLRYIVISPDCTAGRLADSSPTSPAVHYGILAVNKTDITRWCGFCSGLLVLSCSVTNMVGSQKFPVSVWGRNRLPSRCIHYFPQEDSPFLY